MARRLDLRRPGSGVQVCGECRSARDPAGPGAMIGCRLLLAGCGPAAGRSSFQWLQVYVSRPTGSGGPCLTRRRYECHPSQYDQAGTSESLSKVPAA